MRERISIECRDDLKPLWRGHQGSRAGLEPAIARMHTIENSGETCKTAFLASPVRICGENGDQNFVNFVKRGIEVRDARLRLPGGGAFFERGRANRRCVGVIVKTPTTKTKSTVLRVVAHA